MSTTSTPWESLVSTREAAGVSRYRLAQDMGINLSHLGRLERGEASPRADTIRRAAEALGVPVEQVTPAKADAALVLTVEQLREVLREELASVTTLKDDSVPVQSNDVADIAQDIVQKHTPYAWGGGGIEGPSAGVSDGGGVADRNGDYLKIGFDDASLAQFIVYQAFGVVIPRKAWQQRAAGTLVSTNDAQPGDLVFYAGKKDSPYVSKKGGLAYTHVMVHIGRGWAVDAPGSGEVIRIRRLEDGGEFRRFRPSTSEKLWGVYLNTDMTEGRGMRYLARLFRTELQARRWVETQHDYPGHPMHVVKEVDFDLAALDAPEGLHLPR